MSEEKPTPEEIEQAAKDILWHYFLMQYTAGWKRTFPRSSSAGDYMKRAHLEFLEWVGPILAKKKLLKDVRGEEDEEANKQLLEDVRGSQ